MTQPEDPSVSGEVLSDEAQEKLLHAMEKVRSAGLVSAHVAAQISRSPFFNRLTKKRIDSAQAVVRAESAFMSELRDHQLMKDRLFNLDVEIAAQRKRQQADLTAAEVQHLENELKREQLKAALAALENATQDVAVGKSQEERYQEQLEAAGKRAAFDAQRKVQQAREKLTARGMLAAERERMIAEIMAASGGNPSPEQAFEIENITDLFQTLLDET